MENGKCKKCPLFAYIKNVNLAPGVLLFSYKEHNALIRQVFHEIQDNQIW